jgi:hypothetical protein
MKSIMPYKRDFWKICLDSQKKVANIFDHFSLFGELFIIAIKICISLSYFTFFDKAKTKSNPYRIFNKTVLLKGVVILLLLPINLIIIILFAIRNIFLLIVSLSCVFIRRLLIFITKIQASVIALRLFKEYKILDRNQQNVARIFLFSCALTYLCSSSIYRLF